MQFLSEIKQTVTQFAEDNTAALLTAGGVVGTVATAVLAGRAGYKTGQFVLKKKDEIYSEQTDNESFFEDEEFKSIHVQKRDVVLGVGLEYAPPIVLCSLTVASIVMANRVSAQKAAALAAAYGLAERNLTEYKAKVSEKLTGPKKQALEEELSQDRVNRAGEPPQTVVIVEGEHLCFDEATDRYFHSTMEKIRGAVNKINEQIHNEDYADASDFYHLLGLNATQWSGQVGWNRDHMLEVKYDTVTAPDGRPCISIAFSNFPREDFIRKNY